MREETARRNEEIASAVNQGASKKELIETFHLSEYWLGRILTSLRKQKLISNEHIVYDQFRAPKPALRVVNQVVNSGQVAPPRIRTIRRAK